MAMPATSNTTIDTRYKMPFIMLFLLFPRMALFDHSGRGKGRESCVSLMKNKDGVNLAPIWPSEVAIGARAPHSNGNSGLKTPAGCGNGTRGEDHEEIGSKNHHEYYFTQTSLLKSNCSRVRAALQLGRAPVPDFPGSQPLHV